MFLVKDARRGVGVYVSESILVIGARRDVGVYVSESVLVKDTGRDVGVYVLSELGAGAASATSGETAS